MNHNLSESPRSSRTGKQYRVRALIFLAVSGIIFVIYFFMIRMILQDKARYEQEQNYQRFFSSTLANLDNNAKEINSLKENFNNNNMTMLNDLVMAYSGNNYNELSALTPVQQSDLLYNACSSMQNCAWIFLINREGKILVSDVPENNGLEILGKDDADNGLTEENFHELCDGRIEHLIIDNPYENDEYFTGSKFYLYCESIPGAYGADGNKYFLLAFSSEIIDATVERLSDLSIWLNISNIGNNGSVFMVDAETDTIRYGSFLGEETTGEKASKLGLPPSVLKDRYNGDVTINGVPCYISVRASSSELFGRNNYVIAAIPLSDMYGATRSVILWNCCLFLFFVVLMLAYSAFVRADTLKKQEDLKGIPVFPFGGNGIYFSRTLAGKILPIVLTASVMVFFAAFYFQDLMKLSDAFSESVGLEKEISRNVEEGASLQKEFSDYYSFQYESRAQLLSYIISLNGEDYFDFGNESNDVRIAGNVEESGNRDVLKDSYRNPVQVINCSDPLMDLSDENNVRNIYLISDTGVTLATSSTYWNFSLSTDPEAQSNEFWDILNGKQTVIVQDPMKSDEGVYSQFIGCPMDYYTCLDEEGNTKFVDYIEYLNRQGDADAGSEITRHTGLLQIELNPDDESRTLESATPKYILSNTMISNDGFLIGFQYDEGEDDYEVFYTSEPAVEDRTAGELGLSGNAFSGEYNGFQTVNGDKYLQSVRKVGDYYISTAMPVKKLYEGTADIAWFCALFSLAAMLLIFFYTVFYRDMDDEEFYREENDPLAIFGHWTSLRSQKKTTPLQRFEAIVRNSLIILGIVFLAAIIYDTDRYGSNSAIVYILQGEWDRGIHVFSLSSCFVIVIIAAIIFKVFSHIVYLIASAFGNRAITMIRLLISLLRAGLTAVLLFYCLYLLGIHATRLLASAGILSVVVGLGAQSLLGDVLAGIFIVMEGSLHVGDYVTIEGVRGKVLEIGMRTTRYEDDNQNIRVIRNNEIKSFANMSMKYSVIYYNIPVPYEEDFLKIRKVLNEGFVELYENNRFLKSIPVCQGIEKFGESAVEMRVKFMCDESERYDVQRFMHDQIMRIFRENNVTIPFNQLDVHFDRELSDAPEQKISEESQIDNPKKTDYNV